VHVIGPENGATLPGMTVVCGDSHTSRTAPSPAWRTASAPPKSSTCWPRSACAEEVEDHAGPRRGRSCRAGVTAKDVVLAIIGRIGTAGGTGYAIEFGGRRSARCRWKAA
jgi:3-isopropylmalate/(R)-2-methylmalate dehydratase large subunit